MTFENCYFPMDFTLNKVSESAVLLFEKLMLILINFFMIEVKCFNLFIYDILNNRFITVCNRCGVYEFSKFLLYPKYCNECKKKMKLYLIIFLIRHNQQNEQKNNFHKYEHSPLQIFNSIKNTLFLFFNHFCVLQFILLVFIYLVFSFLFLVSK